MKAAKGGRSSGGTVRRSRPGRGRRRVLAGVGLLIVVNAAIGAAIEQIGDYHARRYRPPGRLVSVNGHRMHIWCEGSGSPTVVLIAGLGEWSLDWRRVQPTVASSTRVCSYDRPGMGWSDPHAASLTSAGIAADLHALLDEAHIAPPYLLVGHSVGGIYARLFAQAHPAEVTGMVFVDSAHEEQFSRYPSVLRQNRSQLRLLRFARYLAPVGLGRLMRKPVAASRLPAPWQHQANALGYRTSSYFAFYDEASRFLKAADGELHLPAPSTFTVPIVVISSGKHLREPKDGQVWGQLQRDLVALSPCGAQLVSPQAGHNIQTDDPDSVVTAINQVLNHVRGGTDCRART